MVGLGNSEAIKTVGICDFSVTLKKSTIHVGKYTQSSPTGRLFVATRRLWPLLEFGTLRWVFVQFSCVESSWRLVGSVEVDRSVDIFFGWRSFWSNQKISRMKSELKVTVRSFCKLTQKTQGILLILFFLGNCMEVTSFFRTFLSKQKVGNLVALESSHLWGYPSGKLTAGHALD